MKLAVSFPLLFHQNPTDAKQVFIGLSFTSQSQRDKLRRALGANSDDVVMVMLDKAGLHPTDHGSKFEFHTAPAGLEWTCEFQSPADAMAWIVKL